jgi:hypothetical protein
MLASDLVSTSSLQGENMSEHSCSGLFWSRDGLWLPVVFIVAIAIAGIISVATSGIEKQREIDRSNSLPQISGIVSRVEHMSSFNFVGIIVYFQDGRVKTFGGAGNFNHVFKIGVINAIKYERTQWGSDYIVSVN